MLRVIGIFLVILPFAFAGLRAFTVRYDLRFFLMASAVLAAAFLVMTVGKARSRQPSGLIVLWVIALAVAAGAGAAVAFLLGSRGTTSVLFVATAFSLCSATALALSSTGKGRRPQEVKAPGRSN